jgi:hypothetical protein
MAQFINNERKHNHIEYEELYEAHFNPIAEDLEDEISNRIKIQYIMKFKLNEKLYNWCLNLGPVVASFPFVEASVFL